MVPASVPRTARIGNWLIALGSITLIAALLSSRFGGPHRACPREPRARLFIQTPCALTTTVA